jgi:hypothetical protein
MMDSHLSQVIQILTCVFAGISAIIGLILWITRRRSAPDFFLSFPGYSDFRDLRPEDYSNIFIEVENTGEIKAEDIEIHIFLPPEFEISAEKQPNYDPKVRRLFKEDSESGYPNHWNVMFTFDGMLPHYKEPCEIRVKSPRVPKIYPIHIEVGCKGGGIKGRTLFLQVS